MLFKFLMKIENITLSKRYYPFNMLIFAVMTLKIIKGSRSMPKLIKRAYTGSYL